MQRWRRRSEIRTETQGEKYAQIRPVRQHFINYMFIYYYLFLGMNHIYNYFICITQIILLLFIRRRMRRLANTPLPGKDRTLLVLPLNMLSLSKGLRVAVGLCTDPHSSR